VIDSSKSPKTISVEEVLHVAKLARIELDNDEASVFAKQLSEIVSYADKLQEVDTSKVEPLFNTTELINVLREDSEEYQEPLSQDKALANAPEKEKGYFKVKQVL